jgi:hypothetical protein
MSEQAKALVLADLMSAMDYDDTRAAAAELRRLHSVNAELLGALRLISTARARGFGLDYVEGCANAYISRALGQ